LTVELEIICTDRNLINKTVAYKANDGCFYSGDQIVERIKHTRFFVRKGGTKVELGPQHFKKNGDISDFLKDLDECEPPSN
jgi:hypothetical protein